MFFKVFLIAFFFFLFALNANAQIAEVRIGVSEFDEKTLNLGLASPAPIGIISGEQLDQKENSVAINGEIIFGEPEFLKWALSPQPYIGGTINLDGKTSYGGAGLLWRQSLGNKFYGDFSIGLVVHDGTTVVPSDIDFFDRLRRVQNEIQFGSRVLFREQLTLGYRFTNEWAGEMFIEHLSNGGLLSSEANEGADILGIRVAKRF